MMAWQTYLTVPRLVIKFDVLYEKSTGRVQDRAVKCNMFSYDGRTFCHDQSKSSHQQDTQYSTPLNSLR
jgi:hypothetical protein